MTGKKHSFCGEVRKRQRESSGAWNYEKTKKVCLDVNSQFVKLGVNPAPRFREEINKGDESYIRQWLMGCHFKWLNPRKN